MWFLIWKLKYEIVNVELILSSWICRKASLRKSCKLIVTFIRHACVSALQGATFKIRLPDKSLGLWFSSFASLLFLISYLCVGSHISSYDFAYSKGILESLRRRAQIMTDGFNSCRNVSCNFTEGNRSFSSLFVLLPPPPFT